MDKLDMSLDDIIAQTKPRGRGGFRGRLGRGRSSNVYRGGVQRSRFQRQTQRPRYSTNKESYSRELPDVWEHDMYNSDPSLPNSFNRPGANDNSGINSRGSLMISNLDYGVNDADIEELFKEFGPLIKASIHFDKSGRSLGTAEVIYRRYPDAVKAMNQYNGVPLDGRDMKINILEDKSQSQSNPGNRFNNRSRFQSSQRRMYGRGGRRGSGRSRQTDSVPTAEELDAEMDEYNAQVDSS